MAPAPKSRIPKGVIHEDSSHQPLPEEGISDNGGERTSIDNRRSSVGAPRPRFQMRVQNHGKDSDDHLVTRVGTTDEIREHLKHLGPSNLASRPRQTRYQNVKIKRGRGSPSRSSYTDMDSAHSSSVPRAPSSVATTMLQSSDMNAAGKTRTGSVSQAEIDSSKEPTSTTPLLQPAEQQDNSSSAEYGSIGRPASQNHTIMPSKATAGVAIPEVVNEEDNSSRSRKSSSNNSAQRYGTSKSSELKHDDPSMLATTPARSGAITEHVVDVNGVKKVVLHANSSSSSSDGDVIGSRHLTDEDREREEQRNQKSSSSVSSSHGGGGDGQSSHKKRHRRKKRASRQKD